LFFLYLFDWTFLEISCFQIVLSSCSELLELSCYCFQYLIMLFLLHFLAFSFNCFRSENLKLRCYFTLMNLFLSLRLSLAHLILYQIFDFICFIINYSTKMFLLLNIYAFTWILRFCHLDYCCLNFANRHFLMRRTASFLMIYFR
jgi:hypothetical protein